MGNPPAKGAREVVQEGVRAFRRRGGQEEMHGRQALQGSGTQEFASSVFVSPGLECLGRIGFHNVRNPPDALTHTQYL